MSTPPLPPPRKISVDEERLRAATAWLKARKERLTKEDHMILDQQSDLHVEFLLRLVHKLSVQMRTISQPQPPPIPMLDKVSVPRLKETVSHLLDEILRERGLEGSVLVEDPDIVDRER